MPFYELNLILRPMPKKELVSCLKRVANLIWNEDGVLKKIDYLGNRKLPWEIRRLDQDERFNEGEYFMYHISMRGSRAFGLRPEFKLDVDLLNYSFVSKGESKIPDDYECTLEEELLQPAFRKSVKPLLDDKNVRADVRR